MSQRKDDLKYLSGFRNHFETEALPGALPLGQNSPQKVKYGLYAEQFSGSAFTAPREQNLKSWLYRIRPSVLHEGFVGCGASVCAEWMTPGEGQSDFSNDPNQMRWNALPAPKTTTSFLTGVRTIVANGSPSALTGVSVSLYSLNESMKDEFFMNSDAEMVFVLEQGNLVFKTEFGVISATPTEIVILPRGMKFQIEVSSESARGYFCENFGIPFRLPELGPIGANGLAASRDFQSPVATYEERVGKFKLINKYCGKFYEAKLSYSPLDVVAWHGNYAPSKYDLKKFNTIGTVSFDHPDPSIFTVLTSPSAIPGTANCDFVIFPPRYMVAENTFRPPYFHRNLMSEYMGLILGKYDAKSEGFAPGGGSLHNRMSAHGPDAETFEKASNVALKPEKIENTLAFMFETALPFQVTKFGRDGELRQRNYQNCWSGLKSHFEG